MTEKEKLEEAKRLYQTANADQRYVLESLFPELAESEDERIRKAIINTIEDCSPILSPEVQKRMIAWLEKQGEQKSIFDFNANNWCVNKVDGKIHNIYNSGLEPKFHKDEWVVNNATLNLCHILRVEHGQYICDDCSFPITKENEYHLWTIQDAKDGDVLDANGAPFIYKKHDKDYVYFYCGVNLAGEFVEANEFDTWNNNNKVYPATKEQRDFLFKKMKEAGCTFDFEKKELKKIVVPIFNIGDTIAKKHNSDINMFGRFTITNITDGMYWYNDRIICDFTEQDKWELVKQKTAEWSEEDEHRLKDTIYFLDTAKKHYASIVELDACINWLKTTKQRMEDEQ